MKLTKTSDGYVVRVPLEAAEALDLHDGDEVVIEKIAPTLRPLSEREKDDLVRRAEALARSLPPGYRFDREEANAR